MKERTVIDWTLRIVLGGLCGWLLQLLICSSFSSIGLMGPSNWHWSFSMLILGWNTRIPYDTADKLATALMFLIGAELGLSTLPFSEYGGRIRLETALHFAAMMLTVSTLGWLLGGTFYYLVPSALLYLLIWLGRWVGWYAELEQIKEKLGVATHPSPLRWRETLPHIGFAFLLCGVLPLALRLLDPPDVPVLSVLLAPLLLLPGSFVPGVSLGLRQGFCPLYPLACGLFSFAVAPFSLTAFWLYPLFSFFPALLGLLAGCGARVLRGWWKEVNAPE